MKKILTKLVLIAALGAQPALGREKIEEYAPGDEIPEGWGVLAMGTHSPNPSIVMRFRGNGEAWDTPKFSDGHDYKLLLLPEGEYRLASMRIMNVNWHPDKSSYYEGWDFHIEPGKLNYMGELVLGGNSYQRWVNMDTMREVLGIRFPGVVDMDMVYTGMGETVDIAEVSQVAEEAARREAADALFADGQYAEALDTYRPFAEEGDKFAQYRLALIHYFGLAGEVNKPQAYAWAMVAQEEGILILRQLAVLIGQELDEAQMTRARERFEELDEAHGSFIVTQPAQRPDCTGSRVGAGCERVIREFDRSPGSDVPDFYRNVTGPNEITPAYVADFSDTYSDRINQEFARFDQGG